jgi:hypothetical protein
MTRQFHARMRRAQKPKPHHPRLHTLSFKCFRFVPIASRDLRSASSTSEWESGAIDDGADAYEIVELCDPRNAMSALLFER